MELVHIARFAGRPVAAVDAKYSLAARMMPDVKWFPGRLQNQHTVLPLTSDERRRNFAFLQAVADAIGKEFEAKPFEELAAVAEHPAFQRVVDGVRVNVSARARRRAKDDALSVYVDVQADLPTPLGARPVYTFRKRRDGSVF
jgi:hypothetical protein